MWQLRYKTDVFGVTLPMPLLTFEERYVARL